MLTRILPLLCVPLTLAAAFPLYAEDINKPVPACTLAPLEGGATYGLQQFKGQVVYVDFWASWCASCAKSFPFLNELNTAYKDKGLHIVAISVDENMADAKTFASNHNAQFTLAADANKQCVANFAVEAMPSTFLIDKKGLLRYVHLGFRPGETKDLQHKVEQLLAER